MKIEVLKCKLSFSPTTKYIPSNYGKFNTYTATELKMKGK